MKNLPTVEQLKNFLNELNKISPTGIETIMSIPCNPKMEYKKIIGRTTLHYEVDILSFFNQAIDTKNAYITRNTDGSFSATKK